MTPEVPPGTPSPKREHLSDFMAENWGALAAYSGAAGRELDRVSRAIPASFYNGIFQSMNDFLNNRIGKGGIKIRLVIDSNIIVADAFRVAKGLGSSTARIFESEFIEPFAPPQIVDEVKETIEKDLPAQYPKHVAHAHAKQLLDRVKIVEPTSSLARAIAQARLETRDPDDQMFLALALESDAEAVVSRDKTAFDGQVGVSRWEMRKVATTVVSYEAGSLALVVTGAALEGIAKVVELVIVGLIRIVLEVASGIAKAVVAGIESLANAVAANPGLFLGGLLVAVVGVAIGAAISPEFKEFLGDSVEAIVSTVSAAAKALVAWLVKFARAVHAFLVWVWNVTLPATAILVASAGVLLGKILALADEVSTRAQLIPSTG